MFFWPCITIYSAVGGTWLTKVPTTNPSARGAKLEDFFGFPWRLAMERSWQTTKGVFFFLSFVVATRQRNASAVICAGVGIGT